MSAEALRHGLLEELGVAHGFGLRGSPEPPGVWRPRQVHGRRVVEVEAGRDAPAGDLGEADAVVSSAPGRPVAVRTADCLPLLVAAESGARVAAIHAGWRGLARGVIEAALRVMREGCPPGTRLRVAIGPHIGACCYEVDAPVLEALRERFADALPAHLERSRPGHARLDLAGLACRELDACGLMGQDYAVLAGACTACDPARFHSYRRDGAESGRLLHWIAARPEGGAEGRGAG